ECFRRSKGATPEVNDKRNAPLAGERGDRVVRREFGEPADVKVALMDAENQTGLRSDGARIILQARFVRRPNFAQPGATCFQHFPDAEAAADLDQLAAGDDHFGFLSKKMPNDKDERGGAVVDHRRRFASAGERETVLKISRAPPATAADQIELEVVIARG